MYNYPGGVTKTKESYIIVGFCQSILINLRKGPGPRAHYGFYAYDWHVLCIVVYQEDKSHNPAIK